MTENLHPTSSTSPFLNQDVSLPPSLSDSSSRQKNVSIYQPPSPKFAVSESDTCSDFFNPWTNFSHSKSPLHLLAGIFQKAETLHENDIAFIQSVSDTERSKDLLQMEKIETLHRKIIDYTKSMDWSASLKSKAYAASCGVSVLLALNYFPDHPVPALLHILLAVSSIGTSIIGSPNQSNCLAGIHIILSLVCTVAFGEFSFLLEQDQLAKILQTVLSIIQSGSSISSWLYQQKTNECKKIFLQHKCVNESGKYFLKTLQSCLQQKNQSRDHSLEVLMKQFNEMQQTYRKLTTLRTAATAA